MTDVWDRLEPLLATHAPLLAGALRPPASNSQVAAAEAAMEIELPADVSAAYLRHDGCTRDSPQFFVPFFRWCSLEEMVARWRMRVEVMDGLKEDIPDAYPPGILSASVDAEVRHNLWIPQWISIGLSGTRSDLCVDLNPGNRGVKGQLIHDDGEGGISVIDSSLNDYVSRLIDRLERGVLDYEGREWIEVRTHSFVYSSHWREPW